MTTTPRTRTTRLAAVAFAGLLALGTAACGDDAEDEQRERDISEGVGDVSEDVSEGISDASEEIEEQVDEGAEEQSDTTTSQP
jgi:hypothetical protein